MRPLALTMGDPAGIGGELTLRAWQVLRGDGRCFVVLDDPDRLRRLAAEMGLDVPVATVSAIDAVPALFPDALPVLPIRLATPAQPGRADPRNAAAVVASIERATDLAARGLAGAVVTNPINKAALYDAGFAYPGHTEFLAALTGAVGKQIMMLASPALRVVPVTVHASLRQSIEMITTERIVAAARTTEAALRLEFGIARPRLAIAGLNPHAGEQGALGDEETTIIGPAIIELRSAGLEISGPWPPDTMFTEAARERYDVAICMYHDQALIPLKTLDMTHGVNVTLGLPIVRTSVDHGTAYDLAGTGKADARGMREAIALAVRLARAGRSR